MKIFFECGGTKVLPSMKIFFECSHIYWAGFAPLNKGMVTVQFSCSTPVWGFRVTLPPDMVTAHPGAVEEFCVDALESFLKQHNLQILLEQMQQQTYHIDGPALLGASESPNKNYTVYMCSHGH